MESLEEPEVLDTEEDEVEVEVELVLDEDEYEVDEVEPSSHGYEKPIEVRNVKLYRVHSNLDLACGKEYPRGVTSALEDISKAGKQILLERGAISEARVPPLDIIPGWYKRAEMLEKVGIYNAAQLICADVAELARVLFIPEEDAQVLIDEVKDYLTVF